MSRSSFHTLPRLGRWSRMVLAGLCLVLAAASAASALGAPGGSGPTIAVVVAARDLPAGHRIVAGDVTRARWPARLVPAGAIRDSHRALGRRLAGPMTTREPLGPARLLGAGLTDGLPRGTVAVPVTVSGTRLTDLIRPGVHVSLVATAATTDDEGSADGGAGNGSFGNEGGSGSPSTDVDVVASRVVVLSVLPGRDGLGTDLVVAVDRITALSLIRTNMSRVLAPVLD